MQRRRRRFTPFNVGRVLVLNTPPPVGMVLGPNTVGSAIES